MAKIKPEFRLGRIVSAYLIGRNRKREEHPVLIISPDREIVQPEEFDPRESGGALRSNRIAVVGISSKYRNFKDPYIQLPKGAVSGLTKDCAAILNWYALLDIPDDCEFLLGDVPASLMVEINKAYKADLEKRLGALQGSLVESLKALLGGGKF